MKYRVLQGLEWAGQNREVGSELEMAESEAADMVSNGLIEEIKEESTEAGEETSTEGGESAGESTEGESTEGESTGEETTGGEDTNSDSGSEQQAVI